TVACGDNGDYTLTFTATDIWGAEMQDTATVSVTNAPPVVETIGPTEISANFGVMVKARYSQPGWLDTHTAVVIWGDGSESPGTVDPLTRTVSASHNYPVHGSYSVTVRVTDDDGGMGELSEIIFTQFRLNLPLV